MFVLSEGAMALPRYHPVLSSFPLTLLFFLLLLFQGKMARDMSHKEILKMELDQLTLEEKTEREPMSKSARELVEWVDSQSPEDCLVKDATPDLTPVGTVIAKRPEERRNTGGSEETTRAAARIPGHPHAP
ncbi:hypothetical protein AAFF_G00341290 [Aldrovandia affinis]|uniref:G protein gamma domain-containing protein n=1 Tax=Aldrovandia affinis TaxID=143900 RepID=A0AAD7SKM5_9TELE|nr:hypothetical protein AAFF_G00341290 [Aldrovandia affinis]